MESAGLLLTTSIGGRVLNFSAYILLTRTLGPNSFGHLMYAYVLVNVIATVSVFGIPQGVSREIAASERPLEVIRSGVFILIPTTALLSIIIYYFRFELERIVNVPEISSALTAFSLLLILIPMSSLGINVMRGYEYSLPTAISQDIAPYIIGLMVFSLLAVVGAPFIGGVVYWISLPLVTLGLSIVVINREVKLRRIFDKYPDREVLRSLYTFSWPLALQSGFIILMTNVDLIAIGYYLDATDVGFYKSVVPIAQLALIILSSFVFLYLPIATKHYVGGDYNGISDIYEFGTKWVTILTFPFVIFITQFSDSVITVVYTADYLPASGALIILTIGMFLRVIVGPNAATVKAINQTKIDLFTSLFGLIVNIVLTIILVPTYGLIGAAIATSIGFLTYNLLELSIIYYVIGAQPFSTSMIKPLIATGSFGVVLNHFLVDYHLRFVHLLLIGGSIFTFHLLSIFITRSFREEDMLLIEQIERQTNLELTFIKDYIS